MLWVTIYCSSTSIITQFCCLFSDSGSSSAWSPLYNGGATGANGTRQLDTDTINYIHRIYCRECRMEAEKQAREAAGTAGGDGSVGSPTSPMQQVEEASLAMAMDTNKECKNLHIYFSHSMSQFSVCLHTRFGLYLSVDKGELDLSEDRWKREA